MLTNHAYTYVFWGIWLIVVTLVAQSIIAALVKARQSGAIPGKLSGGLSHESFVFRSHRTFHNSLENVPAMLATAFLAVFVKVDAQWASVCVWLFAIARLVHMLLYYNIATEKNPSPRSYFYLLGFIANAALLALIALALV